LIHGNFFIIIIIISHNDQCNFFFFSNRRWNVIYFQTLSRTFSPFYLWQNTWTNSLF
jgi:hypothetical protein